MLHTTKGNKLMKKVLFICEGNVGRSQMAEGFYKRHKGKESATSAGTADVGAKFNFIPRDDILFVMNEKDIDISNQRIKQLTESMIDDVEMIIVLCDPSLLPPFILASGINILFKEVQDPYLSDIEGVRQVRDTIESIILDFIDNNSKESD